MPSARASAIADAPVSAVWALLADIERWPRWLRVPYADQAVSVSSAGPPRAGAEFTLQGKLPFRLFARVSEWQEGRRLAFEIYRSEYPSDRFFFRRAAIAIDLEELGGHTRVTCTHSVWGRGVLGRLYMATAFRPFLRSSARGFVRSLRSSVG